MTSDIEEKIKRDLIANPPQIFKENNSCEEKGFELNLDTNSTQSLFLSEPYRNN